MDLMEWIAQPTNAAAVQTLLAVVQVGTVVALLWVIARLAGTTGRYAKSTDRISAETHVIADATKEMIREAREQRRDATMPVLVLRAVGQREREAPSSRGFVLVVENQGTGPALNVIVGVHGARLSFRGKLPKAPCALGVGGVLYGTYVSTQLPPEALEEGELVAEAWATYDDVYGRHFRSVVALECRAAVNNAPVNPVRLGPLSFEQDDLSAPVAA